MVEGDRRGGEEGESKGRRDKRKGNEFKGK